MFTINQNLIDDFADKINEKEKKSNKVTSLSSSSTDTQYPSAKCVYDTVDVVDDKVSVVYNTVSIIDTSDSVYDADRWTEAGTMTIARTSKNKVIGGGGSENGYVIYNGNISNLDNYDITLNLKANRTGTNVYINDNNIGTLPTSQTSILFKKRDGVVKVVYNNNQYNASAVKFMSSNAMSMTRYTIDVVLYQGMIYDVIDSIPSKTSDLTNDSNFLTSHQDISGKEDKSNKVASWSNTTTDAHYPSEKLVKDSLDGKANSTHNHTKSQITDFPTIPSKTSDLTNDSGFLTSHQSLDSKTVTVEKLSTATNGYLSSYAVKQNGVQVGNTIDIPKDFLVKSGSVKTVITDNHPVSGYSAGDKYIDFVINTKDNSGTDEHMYILVSDLVQDNGIEYINGTHSDTSTFIFTGNSYVFNSVSDIKDGSMIIYRVPVTSTNDSNNLKLQIICKGASGYGAGSSTAYIMKNNVHVTASQYPINTKLLLMYQNGWNIIGQTNPDDSYATANHTHSQYLTSHQDITGKENISNKISDIYHFTNALNEYPNVRAVQDYVSGELNNFAINNDLGLGSVAFSNDYEDLNNLPQLGNLAYENDVDLSGHDLDELSDNTNLLFSGDYDDLDNKPTIPTATSDLSNDGDGTNPFLTEHQSLTNYLQKSDVKNNLTSTDTNKPLSALQGNTLKSLVDTKQDIIKGITVTNDGRLYLLTQAPRYITYSNTKTMLAYENDYGDISITVTDENHEIIEGAEVQFYIRFGDDSVSPTRYLYTDNTGTCTTRVFSEELSTASNQINIKYGEYTSRYNMGREPNIVITDDDLETPL